VAVEVQLTQQAKTEDKAVEVMLLQQELPTQAVAVEHGMAQAQLVQAVQAL
jgi:hypothetical protein